ncbi:MAG: exopolysaccharide biosynthesis polyprenyl glycosylphosphotransferase, partial [Anaerolineaceae bacterium]|nr:exopolysaccharide biosynthesis polyprenyl glycosylphosphotransferase [Anaerolineaceae bacterium]
MKNTDLLQVSQKPLFWRLHPGERRLILFIGDALASMLALMVALYFWAMRDTWLDFSWEFLRERPDFWFYLLPIFWVLLIIELYDVRRAGRVSDTIRGIAIATGICLGVYLLVFFLSPPNSLPRRGFAVYIAVVTFLTLIWRLIYIQVFTAPLFLRRAVIVGAGRAGSTLAKIIAATWPQPFHVVGFVDDDIKKIGQKVEGYDVLGGSQNLFEVIRDFQVTDIIFAISTKMKPEMFQALITAEEQGIVVITMPVVYEEILGRVPIFLLQSDWLLRTFFDQAHVGSFFEMAKRLTDVVGGLVGTVVLLFLLPFISLAILLDSGRPVFYSQTRLGRSGQSYRILKFRTMNINAEKDGVARPALENDVRVTRIGRLLRKSHLDEFPQFINVLRGEMSLVGPRAERPEIVEELQVRVPFYRARLLVRPGITGWAQTNFGYANTVEANG